MLTDSQRLLISAAVDGPLAGGASVEFRQLLAASSEALALYQTLQAHSARLAALPRRQLPAASARAVASAWAALPAPRPRTTVARPPVRHTRRWLGLAVAACALVAVTAFAVRPNRGGGESPPHSEVALVPPAVHPVPQTGDPVGLPPRPLDLLPAASPAQVAVDVPPANPTNEAAPPPRVAVEKSLIGSGQFESLPGFEVVDIRLPTVTTAAGLADLSLETFFPADAGESALVRLDLFAGDPAAGVALVRDAARSAKLTVVTDALTDRRLREKLPLAYAMLADSLSPAQAGEWLKAVAAATASHVPPVLGVVHVAPAGGTDRRETRDLFGVSHDNPAAPSGPKSVVSATIGQVTGSLSHAAGETALTTYAPKSLRVPVPLSAELRGYASRHSVNRRGGVSLLLVVRPRESSPAGQSPSR